MKNQMIQAAPRVEITVTPTARPRRTIAQYRREKAEQLKAATPAPAPIPITQEDEINAAKAANYNQRRILPDMATMRTPLGISQAAVSKMLERTIENLHAPAFIPRALKKASMQFEHWEPTVNAVVHPETGETITKYEKLANDPVISEKWTAAMCKELGRLSQ
eukprot:scaffold46788_cov45-Cyclotella_meneghiniana.AAC.3